jgi:aryl-alcohol dehydrogenase-like predicted oxidoreductase
MTRQITGDADTRVGLGLAALGRPAYLTSSRGSDIGPDRSMTALRQRTFDVLDAAYRKGIRYVDTARSYGRAEEFLADWLRARPDVGDIVVASKWGYRYVGDWRVDAGEHEIKDHTPAAFETQLAETTALLGPRLSLYQVHSVTPDSPVLANPRLQHMLATLRDRGVRVGLSTSGPSQATVIRAALGLEVGGAPLFASVQSTWNLLETSAQEALSEAHAAGLAVVIKECFANGRLVPGTSDLSPAVKRAAHIAAELQIGLDQLAIAAAVHQPWAARVLSGAVTVAQIESHIQGARTPLPTGVLAELVSAGEDPQEYWTARSARSWS